MREIKKEKVRESEKGVESMRYKGRGRADVERADKRRREGGVM